MTHLAECSRTNPYENDEYLAGYEFYSSALRCTQNCCLNCGNRSSKMAARI